MSSKLRGLVANLALLALACALALFAAEGVLRVVKINTLSNIMVVPDKGVIRIPHAPYVWKKEGFSKGRFNAHGFRDVERTWEKPPGVFRVVVFGDSYTDALQVPLEKSFPSILEKKLNEASKSTRFEVLNLGQSGFGTTDEYVRWLNFGVRYSPDVVLVAFYPGNDIRNNSKKLNTETLACYFVFGPTHELVLDCSGADRYLQARGPMQRAWQALKRHSYLASLVSERIYLLRRSADARARHEAPVADTANLPTTLDPFADGNVYLANPPGAWKDAYAMTEAVFDRFAHDVRERGEAFAVVTLSSPEQIDPLMGSEMQSHTTAPLDFDRPERLIANGLETIGVPVLKLGPVFREDYRSRGLVLHGFGTQNQGHWNERGHALAADEIFRFLVARQLVPIDAALAR